MCFSCGLWSGMVTRRCSSALRDKRRPAGDRPRSRSSQSRRSERGQVTAKLNSKRAKRRQAAGVQLLSKAECEPQRFVRELRGDVDGLEVGQQVTVGRLVGRVGRRCGGHQQGLWLLWRDEAA